MSKKEIRAVIFDLDGVLADSEGLHILAWEEIAREYRLREELMPLQEWVGCPDTEIVRDVVRDHGLSVSPEELLEHKRRIFRRLIAEQLKPVPGSIEALADLDSIPVGLATSSSRSETELMLRILGAAGRFRAVVTSDDVRHSKPAPDSYLLAAQRLGIAADHCAAIEDTSTGVQAARRAGLIVLAVTNSMPAEKLAAAHEIFASTVEAVRWVRSRLHRGDAGL
ncbi:MAG: HAD family phosphatase [Spirochaetales bacterium]|nr:HAD family phosphatase [Spirochaetales bacterium]